MRRRPRRGLPSSPLPVQGRVPRRGIPGPGHRLRTARPSSNPGRAGRTTPGSRWGRWPVRRCRPGRRRSRPRARPSRGPPRRRPWSPSSGRPQAGWSPRPARRPRRRARACRHLPRRPRTTLSQWCPLARRRGPPPRPRPCPPGPGGRRRSLRAPRWPRRLRPRASGPQATCRRLRSGRQPRRARRPHRWVRRRPPRWPAPSPSLTAFHAPRQDLQPPRRPPPSGRRRHRGRRNLDPVAPRVRPVHFPPPARLWVQARPRPSARRARRQLQRLRRRLRLRSLAPGPSLPTVAIRMPLTTPRRVRLPPRQPSRPIFRPAPQRARLYPVPRSPAAR